MDKKLTCFVIIGFGKKTSYANGKLRVLDLDETFTLLIKPVFESLGIDCYRAIDKNLNGSIDELMLQEIQQADFALVDLSTLNANVMWELGVRHALKPNHTIMICEQEQMASIPFDVNHFIIHQYAHSEAGIPYKEVDRFRNAMTGIIKGLQEQNPKVNDSPVFSVLDYEVKPKSQQSNSTNNTDNLSGDSFAIIVKKAEAAKKNQDFKTALALLSIARKFATDNMTLRDNLPFIICREALCTYKLKEPTEEASFFKAKDILEELKPSESQDIEVLGLSGAITKRLYELTGELTYLESSIKFYEKGFLINPNTYNGINVAFMYYKKASILKKDKQDWEDIKLKADYYRNAVLELALQQEVKAEFKEPTDEVWNLVTIAEVYNYKGAIEKMENYENKAKVLADTSAEIFAMTSYAEQKEKIRSIFEILKN